MRPFYYSRTTNFGDYMNSWLWPRVLPDLIDAKSEIRLIGIGSLLKNELARVAGPKVIFGTGSGYGDLPLKETSNTWKFYCVRGPLTAKNFGLDESLAIVDASWLINLLPEFSKLQTHQKGISFVPHWTSAVYGSWAQVCEMAGINFINPMDESVDVITRIANSELVITESLHGAIIADYYRVPWIPTGSDGRVLHFKWLDWCMSVDSAYHSFDLPPSDYVDFLAQRRKPKLGKIALKERTFSAAEFPFKEVSAPSQSSGFYKVMQKVKTKAHNTRNYALEQLQQARDVPPFRSWNAEHRNELAGFMRKLANQRSLLSLDGVRERKIDQLNSALERMRKDYSKSV
jgi:succinoglycan biosynthesis protein ExoV